MAILWQGIWIGVLATALMDLWLVGLHLVFGRPAPAWGVPGRWFAEVARGRIWHDDMDAVRPVPGEAALGWTGHYVVGAVYGVLVPAIWGIGWLEAPRLAPALIVGWVTILAGWLVMSPGMGRGIAMARSATAWTDRTIGLLTHTVFGLGLYLGCLSLRPLGLI